MLATSVKSFMRKENQRPQIEETQAHRDKIEHLGEDIDEYAYKMHKLRVATKNKNTDKIANSIDNKYLPEWHTNKSKEINRLQAQVERLKSTADYMKTYQIASNSTKPMPVKLK